MHHVILFDAASNRTEHTFATLEEAAASCGTCTKLILDGKSGHLEYVGDSANTVRFIETDEIFRFFAYAHLSGRMRDESKRFYDHAEHIALTVTRSPERTMGLRKLLEAKDCIVRACLPR